MFGDKFIWDIHSKKYARKIFEQLPKKIHQKKSIISIGGISGTRKSETAFHLADLFIKQGKETHVVSSDDYYITRWNERNNERKQTNLSNVGPDELDWQRLLWTFETFRNPLYQQIQFFQMSKFSTAIIQSFINKNHCDILIFEGLYACDSRIDADFKVHLGSCDPERTIAFRKKRAKENEYDELRIKIVEKECKAVNKLKQYASLIIE